MAPNYRNSNRRQNRSGLIDHDVFEGLPIRHWRRGLVTVEPSITPESTNAQNDIWAIELPHGMPKDSHLLPQYGQDLLRAARSGKIYRRHIAVEEEEPDPESITCDKPEKKDEVPQVHGYIARAWKQVPRHLESPDVEYLAKRRKGLITGTDYSAVSSGLKSTINLTKGAGIDSLKNGSAAQGQPIGRGVTSQNVIYQNSIIESSTTQPVPPKRKGPFRKKIKGTGRWKRKKFLAPTSAPNNCAEGAVSNLPVTDVLMLERNVDSPLVITEDTELGEDSLGNSDEGEGDDGDDANEHDEEEESTDNQVPALSNLNTVIVDKPEESTDNQVSTLSNLNTVIVNKLEESIDNKVSMLSNLETVIDDKLEESIDNQVSTLSNLNTVIVNKLEESINNQVSMLSNLETVIDDKLDESIDNKVSMLSNLETVIDDKLEESIDNQVSSLTNLNTVIVDKLNESINNQASMLSNLNTVIIDKPEESAPDEFSQQTCKNIYSL